ncbi:MAG: response regulator [Bacteroidota bacterium]
MIVHRFLLFLLLQAIAPLVFSQSQHPICTHLSTNDGLSQSTVNCLLKDSRGFMWFGTQDGLNKYDGYTFTVYKNQPGKDNSLSNNHITDMVEDEKGNLWVGTWGGGLNCFDRRKEQFIQYKHNKKNPNTLSNDFVNKLLVDNQGNVWIGTEGGGLNQFDRKSNQFIQYFHRIAEPTSLSDDFVKALFQDSQHRLWIGTRQGGLNMFDYSSETFAHFQHEANNSESLGSNQVRTIFEDSHHQLWLGTQGGLELFDQARKVFHQVAKNPRDGHNLAPDAVLALAEGIEGQLWIGTEHSGLQVFNTKSETRQQYTPDFADQTSLSSNAIYAICKGSHHQFWMGTPYGVMNVQPPTQPIPYQHPPSISRSGAMLVDGSNGLNAFLLSQIQQPSIEYPLVLTHFKLFNKEVAIADSSQGSAPLQQHISEAKEITLSNEQAILSLTYASLNFASPEKNQYAYKLEGFEEAWNYVGNQRTATYTNLDPGKYVFQVRSLNNAGTWSTNPTSLKINIMPLLWQTWWFKTLSVLLIFGSFGTFHYLSLRSIARQAELERQVQERTERKLARLTEKERTARQESERARKEAETARNEAEEANRAKSVFLATMSHEIRTPMNGVIGMASLLAETTQNSEQREYTETIRSCGESLLTVINDILDFSKIESGKMELEEQNFDLRTCIEEVLDVFANKASQLGLDLIYQIDYNVPAQVIGDGLRLRQILLNLVSNAIKFTPQGEIFVGVHLRKTAANQELELGFEVRDTGIGIPEDKLDRLFKAFSQVDSSTTRKYGGTGLGLVICEKLIGLMGGSIEVKSQVGEGTTFCFTIQTRISTEVLRTYVHNNTAGLEGKRILVIDDNATNRHILQCQLEQWQLVPVMAESGPQALALLSKCEAFDLVITDMQMPGMDGIQLAQSIRKTHATLPIILLSSMGQERKGNNPDLFCSVLTKPVKQHILCNHILTELKQQGKAAIEESVGNQKLSEDFALQFPLRILIAEDNLVNQKLAERILNKLGYKPVVANNGKLAVEALQQQDYELVLMDVQMPEMDGLEATQFIRQQLKVQPIIIAMTANAMQGDREECLQAGMDDYLSKPIKLEELVKVLEKWALQVQNKQVI